MASESTVGPSGIRLPTRTDRVVTVAATQFRVGPSLEANAAKAEALVRQAARGGAQVILLQELFQAPYFCKDQREVSGAMHAVLCACARSDGDARHPAIACRSTG